MNASTGCQPIKLLDLLTNRFLGGTLAQQSETGLRVEVSGYAGFTPGQRLRVALPSYSSFERRCNMRSVKVISSQSEGTRHVVELIYQEALFAMPAKVA